MNHEIYNFGRAFHGHHYSILNLSDPCPSVDKKMRKNIAFSLCGHDLTQEFQPRGTWNLQFLVDFSLVSIVILCLSGLCLGLEKRILKEIMHFLYHLYGHTLAQEPLPRGGGVMKFIILVDPSLVIITKYALFVWTTPWSRFLKKYINFKVFTLKVTSPWDGESWILQFLVSLPYRCNIPTLVKIGRVVLKTHDDGCQPIAIDHLVDL